MNVNDQKYSALRAQGYTGHVSDMLLAWLHANGATSSSITDAWKEMLSAQGYTGDVNDSWRAMLSSLAPPEIGRQINDLERWFWSPAGGISLLFSAVLQASLIPSKAKGDDTPTFTRASVATFTDFEGVVRTVNSGEPRFSGARRVENLLSYSEDLDGHWTPTNGSLSGNTFTASSVWGKVTAPGMGAVVSGDEYVASVTLSGSGTLVLQLQDSVGTTTTGTLTLSSTPTRFTVSRTADTSAWFSLIVSRNGGTAAEWTVHDAQVENVTGQSNQSPSSYVSTDVLSAPYHGAGIDGVAYFDYFNPMVVS